MEKARLSFFLTSLTNTVVALTSGPSQRCVQLSTTFSQLSQDFIFSVWGQRGRLSHPIFLTLQSDKRIWLASF